MLRLSLFILLLSVDANSFMANISQRSGLLTIMQSAYFWVKADSLTGATNGQNISSWTDQAVTGLNLSAAGGVQPTYSTSGAGSNNLPYLHFTNDCMLSATNAVAFNNFSVFTVFRPITVTAGYETIVGSSWDNAFALTLISATPTSQMWIKSSGANSTVLALNNWYIQSHIRTGTTGSGWVNGTSIADTTVPATAALALSMSVGCQATSNYNLTNSDIAEVIVFNTNISNSDRRAAECYLSQKYGISISHGCP